MNDQGKRWLAFAREDLAVAEAILDEGIFNQVCFHSQQCVEKALKGVLTWQGQAPPRTHSITDLLRLLPEDWFAGREIEIASLDDYYIPTRYPDALPGLLPEGLPGRAEAQEALALARSVVEVVEGQLSA